MESRAPIGCNEDEARKYMGLSEHAFASARRRGIIIPIFKGSYSYRLLDDAMQILETEAKSKCKVYKLGTAKTIEDEDNSEPEEGQAEPVGSQGNRSSHRKTQELLSAYKGTG